MKSLINLFKGKTNNSESTDVLESKQSKTEYFCPMKCEGNKVYYESGNCPVCNMKLVTSDELKSNAAFYGNQNHSHGHHGCC